MSRSPDTHNILVVDDDQAVRNVLTTALGAMSADVDTAEDGVEAWELILKNRYDLVMTDIKMPRMDGHSLLTRIKQVYPDISVLVMTGFGTIDAAVRAMRDGASDYVTKPFSIDDVMDRTKQLLDSRVGETGDDGEYLNAGHEKNGPSRLVGASRAMRDISDAVRSVAANRSTVLIQGETGTGKELVARSIHFNGQRRDGPFTALNCGSVSQSLLESQLFGHVKGAFTGAVNDAPGYFVASEGGTLFLDEITEIATDVQVRLLRAIQEREVTPVGGTTPLQVDARIIAATNRDARAAVESGHLRRDLYYRLSVVVIELPSLREHKEDIPLLVDHFNRKFSSDYGVKSKEIAADAMDLILGYDWPGNVRELENVVERAFALGSGDALEPGDLPVELMNGERGRPPSDTSIPTLKSSEEDLVRRALAQSGGNKSLAARRLGIDRKRLYRLMKRCGLTTTSDATLSTMSGGNQ